VLSVNLAAIGEWGILVCEWGVLIQFRTPNAEYRMMNDENSVMLKFFQHPIIKVAILLSHFACR